jgi:hypothetical protein
MLVRVLQRLEVPFSSSTLAGVAVPRAAVLVRVPQRLEVPSTYSAVAGGAIPRATAQVEPYQRVQLPLPSSGRARACFELALPVVDQLLEGAHAADGRG